MVDIATSRMETEFGAATGPVQIHGLYSTGLKRSFDVIAVLLAAPIVLPVIAFFALLISFDGGPAFYSQTRVGRQGRIFRCWKLRTMIVDAEAKLEAYLAANPAARAEWDETQKLKDDPRITWIGRILRKISLDELPQLWNVLTGDMSLVGPRPMMPDQTALYPGQAYYQLRPGITGFWQISDRNDGAFAVRALHDTSYANRVSLATDLGVLVATVGVVFKGTGY